MSKEETTFIKWFGSIAVILIVSFIIGGVVMFRTVAVLANDINHNAKSIEGVKQYHKDDVKLIREDTKEIKQDVKKILEKL